MPDILEGYRKQKEYLICVDSDGCCHGYHGLKAYNLFRALSEDSGLGGLSQWGRRYAGAGMRINLYTMTRGINRFGAWP